MNLLALFRKPEPVRQPLRAYAATRAENRAVNCKREETTAALRRYVTERRLVAAVEAALFNRNHEAGEVRNGNRT